MSDLPQSVQINEEGPREGFQFEKGPIATERKVELIDALSQTGLNHIQTVSFVNPRRVPGMADAEEVAARFARQPGIAYTGLWLNEKGLERAIASASAIPGTRRGLTNETVWMWLSPVSDSASISSTLRSVAIGPFSN